MSTSYREFLGVAFTEGADGETVGTLTSSDQTGGAGEILHGGAIAALLELVSAELIQRSVDQAVTFKPIGVNIDFLRAGKRRDIFAKADVQKIGGRVANVVATAWQEDRSKPVAVARTIYAIDR